MDKIIDILDSIAYEKGLKIEDVENALKEALIKTAQKMVDPTLLFDANIDRVNKRLELFQKIEVVDEEDERFTIRIHPPLYTKKTTDRLQDLRKPTEELMLIAEHEIISDPSMWFWVHDRWKDGKKKYKGKKGEN